MSERPAVGEIVAAAQLGAPLVPLLHLAQLHAADGGLHVEHAVVAAMVGKIMHSVLQVKVATAHETIHKYHVVFSLCLSGCHFPRLSR